MQECKQRGIAVSLSDYTLGIGQGWSVDEMLAANPDLNGFTLAHESKPIQAGSSSADRVRRARDSTSSSPMNSASVSAADAGPY